MTTSRTRRVSMALLGSILIAATLLLVLDPGAPPAVEPQRQEQGVAEGMGSAELHSEGPTAEPAQAEDLIAPDRQVLNPTEPAIATTSIAGRVLVDPRVSILGATVVAYPGMPGDKKGGFSNLWASLGDMDSMQRSVMALELTGEPVARADVQPDGSFRLEAVPQLHVRLALEHDFYGLKRPEPVHLDGGSEVAVGTLETYLGAHVRGRLMGPGSDSLAVVAIATEPDPMSVLEDPDAFLSMIVGSTSLETNGDEEGRFEFRALWPSPKLRLILKSEDYSGRTEVFSIAAGETREVLLGTQPALSLRATVRDQDNEPVTGARVIVVPAEIGGDAGRGVARRVGRTGDEGAAIVSGLWSGPYRVDVEAAGYRGTGREIEILGVGGEPELIEFILDQGGSVSGVVINQEGEPVEGATVAHMPTMEVPMLGDLMGMLGPDLSARVAGASSFRTDEQGRFKVTGLQDEGSFHVLAVHDDYLAGDVKDVRMGDEDVTIELQRGARIVGTVVAAESEEPIQDFTVENLVSMMMVIERTAKIRTVRDAPDGRFEIDGIPPGSARLRFRADGRAETTKRVRVEAGEEVDVGIVNLEQHAIIRGEVVAPDGRPVPGASVRRKTGGMSDNPMMVTFFGGSGTQTDEDGRFELEGLVPGRLILLAQAQGHASGQSERLRIAAGEELDGVVIPLGAGGTIVGRLLLPPGESVEGWQIIPGQVPSGATSGGSAPEPDGTFRLEHLDPGRYQVTAFNVERMMEFQGGSTRGFRSGQGFDLGNMIETMNDAQVRANCVVKAGEITEIELDATELGTSGITLEVRVTLGDQPLATGWAEITSLDGSSTQVGFVDQGNMRFTGLRAGQLKVQVRSGITYTPVGDPEIVEIPEGVSTHRVSLSLPAGEIRGRVIDDFNGEALGGTLVRLIHEGANLADESLFGFALTDEEGQFQFLGLAEGDYGLAAGGQFTTSESGRFTASTLRGIRLRGVEMIDGLILRARPEAGATVLVTNEAGAPLAGALLLVVDDDGNPVGSMGLTFTGPNGRGEFGGLPEGEFRIVGRSTGLAPGATNSTRVASGEHVDLTLRLGTGPRVTVRITDENGRTLMGATLSARTQGSPWVPATLLVLGVDPDGALSIGPVPAGSWEFRVSHPDTGTFQVSRTIPRGERATLILSPPK